MVSSDVGANVPGVQGGGEESVHESKVVVHSRGPGAGEFDGDFGVRENCSGVCEDVFEVYCAVPFGLLVVSLGTCFWIRRIRRIEGLL